MFEKLVYAFLTVFALVSGMGFWLLIKGGELLSQSGQPGLMYLAMYVLTAAFICFMIVAKCIQSTPSPVTAKR